MPHPIRTPVNLVHIARSHLRSAAGPNPKLFCIGHNKTGTTSIAQALRGLGYRIGDQQKAELLLEDWGRRDFRRIVRYCHSADAFQDIPFSLHFTFRALDVAFPRSKFILTVRDSAEEWYDSLLRFEQLRNKRNTGQPRVPTLADMRADPYRAPGWVWRRRLLMGITGDEPFPEDQYKRYYLSHNERVLAYFLRRPHDLLVLNVAHPDAMQRLCAFLGKPFSGQPMPHLNRTR